MGVVRLVFLGYLLATPAMAGYRVYQLSIRARGKEQKQPQIVLSNLDPYQYESYYAGYGLIEVKMLDTWYCPGDTGHYREYCKKPKEKQKEPEPTPRFDPKRVSLPRNLQPIIP